MTSLVLERLEPPDDVWTARALSAACDRVDDVLAERAVWRIASAGAAQVTGTEELDALIANQVRADDVVLAHDASSALLARAVRERGGHAVWRLALGLDTDTLARVNPRGGFATCIDAYLVSWTERRTGAEPLACLAAAIPSTGIVAATETPASSFGDELRRLAWRMALAEIVRSDRDETVGGTLHPRPTVAAR
jgi:hypothetical protein